MRKVLLVSALLSACVGEPTTAYEKTIVRGAEAHCFPEKMKGVHFEERPFSYARCRVKEIERIHTHFYQQDKCTGGCHGVMDEESYGIEIQR